jgi:lipopolysaccharide biosynthesis protein
MKRRLTDFFLKLFRKSTQIARRAVSDVRGAASILRQNSNFIQEKWTGCNDGKLDGRVCVFVHFDQKGEIHDYVLHYLKAIKAIDFDIIFVSNARTLNPMALSKVLGIASVVIRRANTGYDFGAYKDGISCVPKIKNLELLLLANDSVYGPFNSLATVIGRTRGTRAQFWGLTDSWDTAYHLQSYFLLFGPEAINNPVFEKFWRNVRYTNSKDYIIRKYEVGLTQRLTRAGVRGTALFSTREAARAVNDAVRNGALSNKSLDESSAEFLETVYKHLEKGVPLNISHYLWDYLIVKMGYPFLKRELLQKNPVAIPHIARWQQVITSVSDFDTDIIVRHLEVSLKNRLV